MQNDFCKVQRDLYLTDLQTAKLLNVCLATIKHYRASDDKVPKMAVVALNKIRDSFTGLTKSQIKAIYMRQGLRE